MGTHSIVATYAGDAGNSGSTSATLSQVVNAGGGGTDVVWVEDAVPAGATVAGDGGDGWNWISSNPTPYSGSLAHQSALAAGEHQHYFYYATSTLNGWGRRHLVCVCLPGPGEPAERSDAAMVGREQLMTGIGRTGGRTCIGWGTDGTVYRHSMGALPATGQWVRLSVPAAQIGLEGKTLSGMAYSLYGGRATWDHAGKSSGGGVLTTTTLASSGSPSVVGGNVTSRRR